MQFLDVNREERYYCNHFFRLLCHELEAGGKESGLRAILEELSFNVSGGTEREVASQVYTEVAVFRDIFAAESDKDEFLEQLYDDLLPIMVSQHEGKISSPIRPAKVQAKIGSAHPN